jgi:hypothetical protein
MAQFSAERPYILLLRPLPHAISIEVAIGTFHKTVRDVNVKGEGHIELSAKRIIHNKGLPSLLNASSNNDYR